ncbi:MAG: hypothetical protein IJ631_01245 [Schwartzia sp.]|nr:hypothetical protein [Schwartzia sp. (in: firmicutes)]
MKNSYPAIIRKGTKFLISYVPDFDIGTQGETITDVIEMTRDAIAMTGLCYEDQDIPVPSPTLLENVVCKQGEIATLVDVNFTAYRQAEEKASQENHTRLTDNDTTARLDRKRKAALS